MPVQLRFTESPLNEIVGREPSWIIQSGITLIFTVFIALLSLSWLISYPDSINSNINITSSQPPTNIISKISGRILKIYVKNNQSVSKGQRLLLIESSVDYSELQRVEKELFTIYEGLKNDNEIEEFTLDKFQLGELQPALNQFILDLTRYQSNKNSEHLFIEIKNTKALNHQYHLLQKQLLSKKDTWNTKLALESALLEKKQKLLTQNVITSSEILPIESNYLDKKLSLNDIDIQLRLNEVKIKELSKELSNFKLLREQKLQQLKISVLSSHSELISKIDDWKRKHLLLAPTDGYVSFTKFWSRNQNIKHDEIAVVVANNNTDIIGKIHVPHRGVGKIALGQKVYIELENYPAVEYGKILGEINTISNIPDQLGYLVDVSLPKELITSYGIKLSFTPNLKGRAKIITKEKRLLERFFENIIYFLDKNKMAEN